MKNDTIKITDKVVMARYISGVSSSQKDQDGIFAEAEQIYDHGFTYFNVDKKNDKAIFIPETKTDGLDQSTINWALKKGIINISKALGDLDQTVEGIRHELSTIPGGISSYLEKINRNASAINTLQTAVDRLEDSDQDYYSRIRDLENRISQSGLALCNIDTADDYSVELGREEAVNPSERISIYPKKFIPGSPGVFIVTTQSGYAFEQSELNTADGPQLIYAKTWHGNNLSGGPSDVNVENYRFFYIDALTFLLVVDEMPNENVFLSTDLSIDDFSDPCWLMHTSQKRALTKAIHCEIPHVTLSTYYIDSTDTRGKTTFEFYAYCENGFKFNKNTLDVVGRKYKNRTDEISAVVSLTFNEDATVCKIKINLYPIISGKNTYAFATGFTCVGSVLPIEDTDEPVVNHTVTLNLSNVSDINVSNERTSQTPKTKTLTYTVANNSTLTVPLYKYSNTSDFNYAIDGNPTGGPNYAPNAVVNNSNFYYEEIEGVLVLHITSIWGDCTFDISANYVDDSTIPSQPTDEDDNPVITPTLQVSPSQITLSYDDFEPRVITVTSNSNFTIK